ncbi:hypothetical protein IWT25_00712 [Secundilactobacillus pentosiphilus]|uniref:Uncharacterized protein n=1 Tax=Secundilactobacillus pentosiphilus TaxID=1714682 RepID=A0A1Z5IUW9_9LACO|nr:hypothetical protein [Secundilactobacillus pentosiphilus]GAX05408.1 hypothetical protein IWT25_00712 [Secundilactobacillus pentosiphilus]
MQNVKGKTGLMIGPELDRFMISNPDLRAGSLAKELNITQSMLSKWRSNTSPIQLQYIEPLLTITEGYDDSDELKIAILNKMSFGLVPPMPNKKFVDFNLNALSDRTLAEIDGVIEALKNVRDEFQNPDAPNHQESLKDVRSLGFQCYDLIRYLITLVVATDDKFHLSTVESFQERQQASIQAHERIM